MWVILPSYSKNMKTVVSSKIIVKMLTKTNINIMFKAYLQASSSQNVL